MGELQHNFFRKHNLLKEKKKQLRLQKSLQHLNN